MARAPDVVLSLYEMAGKPSHDKAYSDLVADLNTLHPHEAPPEELFHYTSAGGLLDILQSNQIWATNLEFMNDFLEVKYAKELLMHLVRQERKSARHGLVARFLEDTASALYPFTNVYSFYAVSFCADGGDRLSQWRAYAGEGTGYSIGFRATELIQAIEKYQSDAREEQIELIQVVYRREQQEAIVQDAVRKVCRYIEEHLTKADRRKANQALQTLPNLLCVHLFPYVFSFKAPGFEEEREWRLVTWIPAAVEAKRVKFRASANFTIPYLSLDLWVTRSAGEGTLPISRIIQGPRVESEVGMKSLEILKRKYGYADTEVVASKIPFRYVV